MDLEIRKRLAHDFELVLTPNKDYVPRTALAPAHGSFTATIDSRFMYLPVARKVAPADALALAAEFGCYFTGTDPAPSRMEAAADCAKKTLARIRAEAKAAAK